MDRCKNKWDRYGEVRLLSRNRLLLERHRLLTRYFLDFFKDVDTSAKVLDVGCGDGFFLELLRDLGFQELSGIDPSDPMAKRTCEKGLRVKKANIYDLEENEVYDAILLMDVLEHLDRPKSALKKLYNSLKTGGILFLNVPVCDSLAKRVRRIAYFETREKQMKDWDETHIGIYSKKDIIDMVEDAGFEIQKSQRLSNPFPLIGRFSGKISAFLQQFNLFGVFGDFLAIAAKKQSR